MRRWKAGQEVRWQSRQEEKGREEESRGKMEIEKAIVDVGGRRYEQSRDIRSRKADVH